MVIKALQKDGFHVVWIFLALFLLAACNTAKSPVSSRATIDKNAEAERLGGRLITIVERGDTLYSIAFQHSLDVNQLAAWNGMSDASRLQIGQRIRLTKPANYTETKQTAAKQSKPVQVVRNIPSASTKKPIVASTKPDSTQQRNWQWPVRGQVLQGFSLFKGNKGIDIDTKIGQPVKASAGGKVVYQGNGIKGYGNLVIIKHDEAMLSAYAHNSKVLVKEGQQVKAGQVISHAGSYDNQPMLHFEIRRNGKPVNPLKYLPQL